jgi:hypothetical protein
LLAAAPASAQFFLKSAELPSGRVTGAEPGMTGPALPDASPAELRAALAWNLRAALNVAALQCQFEPTLLTLPNYNAILKDHEVELRESYGTLEKYFTRQYKTKKAGQTELDKFGTRVYSGFSTVSGQLSFCQTLPQSALMRSSPARRFRRCGASPDTRASRQPDPLGRATPPQPELSGLAFGPLPPFGNDKCWRKGTYQVKKCGALVAAR